MDSNHTIASSSPSSLSPPSSLSSSRTLARPKIKGELIPIHFPSPSPSQSSPSSLSSRSPCYKPSAHWRFVIRGDNWPGRGKVVMIKLQ